MLKWISVLLLLAVILPAPISAQDDDDDEGEGWYRTIRLDTWEYLGGDADTINVTLERIALAEAEREVPEWADTVIEYGAGHWTYEWNAVAIETENIGLEAESANDIETAGAKLLEASVYYTVAAYPNFGSTHETEAYENAMRTYELAGQYLSGNIERVDVPYRDTSIPTLLHLPSDVEAPYPVVMITGGIDVFSTEFYQFFSLYLEPMGVAMISFDIPGTGLTDFTLEPDSSIFHVAVLDYLSDDARFDANNIAAVSASMGGHPVTQLAVQEQDRLAAAVSLCGVINEPFLQSPQFYALARSFAPMTIDVFTTRLGVEIGDWDTLSEVTPAYSLMEDGTLTGEVVTTVPILTINTHDDPWAQPSDMLLNVNSSADGELIFIGEEGHCSPRGARQVRVADWLEMYLTD